MITELNQKVRPLLKNLKENERIIINESDNPEVFVLADDSKGLRLELQSKKYDVLQLSNLSLQVYDKLLNSKIDPDKRPAGVG